MNSLWEGVKSILNDGTLHPIERYKQIDALVEKEWASGFGGVIKTFSIREQHFFALVSPAAFLTRGRKLPEDTLKAKLEILSLFEEFINANPSDSEAPSLQLKLTNEVFHIIERWIEEYEKSGHYPTKKSSRGTYTRSDIGDDARKTDAAYFDFRARMRPLPSSRGRWMRRRCGKAPWRTPGVGGSRNSRDSERRTGAD